MKSYLYVKIYFIFILMRKCHRLDKKLKRSFHNNGHFNRNAGSPHILGKKVGTWFIFGANRKNHRRINAKSRITAVWATPWPNLQLSPIEQANSCSVWSVFLCVFKIMLSDWKTNLSLSRCHFAPCSYPYPKLAIFTLFFFIIYCGKKLLVRNIPSFLFSFIFVCFSFVPLISRLSFYMVIRA